jgi:hypothetical protein
VKTITLQGEGVFILQLAAYVGLVLLLLLQQSLYEKKKSTHSYMSINYPQTIGVLISSMDIDKGMENTRTLQKYHRVHQHIINRKAVIT